MKKNPAFVARFPLQSPARCSLTAGVSPAGAAPRALGPTPPLGAGP